MLALCAVVYGDNHAMPTGTVTTMAMGEDPMHPYLIEYAKSMNYSMCNVGSRDMTNGMLTGDSMTPALCEYPGSKCVMFTFTLTAFDGTKTMIENGECVAPMAEAYYTCEAARNDSAAFGTADNCQVNFCEGHLCNVPATQSNTTCEWYEEENDLNFMPGMSMRHLSHHMDMCTQKLYSGYPYQSKDQCRDNFNEMMTCVGYTLLEASNSPCMSMWDWIPGFRTMLNQQRPFFLALVMYDMDLIWDGIVDYYHIDQEMADYIKMYLDDLSCPEPGVVPQCIEDAMKWAQEADIEAEITAWMTSLGLDMNMMGMDMSVLMGQDMNMAGMHSVCNDHYWTASMKASIDYMWQWYSSSSRDEICTAVNTMHIRSINAWDHMCDDNKVYPALIAMYGEENRDSVDVIAKMLMIWDDLYTSYEFPNCDVSTQNKMMLGCEQYYDSMTPCGIRKAWLCDYTEWKVGFLSDWLSEFETFKVNNVLSPLQLDAPACDDYDMTDLCKNSGKQMCMRMPVTGCWACYCSDHEYKDLSGLSMIWRKDYLGWQHVFRTYKRAFGSATCREDIMQMYDDHMHEEMAHDDMHH